ncbi:sensor histidine kinase [Nonomuraea sp. NPDC050556]|uniref:sensor histidine kinase n=1 Tax=Nonomuraea sp. NPDC050556 TaxID=3364369 RepID=UPI0037B0EA76
MNQLHRRNRREVLRDLGMWALFSVLVVASGPDPTEGAGPFLAVSVVGVLLVGLAVLFGRPWPLAAVVLLLPVGPWDFTEGWATIDLAWMGLPTGVKILPFGGGGAAVVTYAYLTGRRTVRVWPALAVLCAVAVTGSAVVLVQGGGVARWITMGSALAGLYAVPYLMGLIRRRIVLQRERARQAAEAQARLRERTRIAHDMHDSLGHDLALIAVRAAGLEVSPGLAPAQAKAAGELRVAAADATERLRRIVGLLREDAAAAPLVPVGEGVADLVDRARASGMTITLELSGEPEIAHRVVQEGLTNAAKHAPGAPVAVTVTPDLVRVRNGRPLARPSVKPGGLGLTGLRERVRLAGWTLASGPSGDGYELTAARDGSTPPAAQEPR